MQKRFAAALVLVLCAAPISASAQQLSLNGADALEAISVDIINNRCPAAMRAASLRFIGGGSTAGENSLVNNHQKVAPMSRPLSSSPAVCTGHSSSAQGMVFAFDGMAILG